MIRFCEKEAQEVYIEDITRTQMLSWFLKSERNRQSVLLCYKKDGFYYGMATYQSVLANTELEKCINKDVLVTDDSFWDKAGGGVCKR